jgi:hypothetical protein
MTNEPSTISTQPNPSMLPTLRKNFDHKSFADWIFVGIMSIPLLVLSIFGVFYLIELANLPK